METKKLCCGIDVSHATLDVCYQNNLGELFYLKVGNNNSGYQQIMEHTGAGYHFVMEQQECITYAWLFIYTSVAAR